MSVLVTADFHWSEHTRDSYRFAAMKTLREVARKYGANPIIILGDLTESKDRHSAWLVNRVVDELYQLAQTTQVIILRGNHDGTTPDNPFFGFVSRIEGITWINRGIIHEVPELGACLFEPHTANHQQDWDWSHEGINWDEIAYMFCHQCFEGAYAGFGHKLTGIPLDVLPVGVKVISGDIHVPQKIGPVTYVGAPYLIDFGDDYEPRVLVLDQGRRLSVKLPGAQKRLLELPEIGALNGPAKGLNSGDIVKVRVCVTMADYVRWPEYQERVRVWGERHGYQIHQVLPVVVKHATDKTIVHQARETKTDDQILRDYARNRGLDDRTLAAGIKLLAKG